MNYDTWWLLESQGMLLESDAVRTGRRDGWKGFALRFLCSSNSQCQVSFNHDVH